MQKFKLMHRTHDDAEAQRFYVSGTTAYETMVDILEGRRLNCVLIGCDVRDSVDPTRPGFVAERNGRFYEAFELVPVEEADAVHAAS